MSYKDKRVRLTVTNPRTAMAFFSVALYAVAACALRFVDKFMAFGEVLVCREAIMLHKL